MIAQNRRIVSLDQFRGYTVAGMFLVNFLGGYDVCPPVLKHHNTYLSYADTIMPHFLFAVGFAFRLTFQRRIQKQGKTAAYMRMVRRLLGLALLSMVIYTVGPVAESWQQLAEQPVWGVIGGILKRNWFQTLMHIAVTSLWILPFIRASTKVRILFMAGSAMLHMLLSYWFNFTWVYASPTAIDGGPLGFLTWTIPAILGTIACDLIVNAKQHLEQRLEQHLEQHLEQRPQIAKAFCLAVVFMCAGYLMSCGTRLYDVRPQSNTQAPGAPGAPGVPGVPGVTTQQLTASPVMPPSFDLDGREWKSLWAEPPFVQPPGKEQRKKNYWMMSQRVGTVSYLTFAAGLSLFVYMLFYLACDVRRWKIGLFRTFGMNALAAYIIHSLVSEAVEPFVPDDSPFWYVSLGFVLFFGITYLIVQRLEANKIYIKL